jgi:hypothetical protein
MPHQNVRFLPVMSRSGRKAGDGHRDQRQPQERARKIGQAENIAATTWASAATPAAAAAQALHRDWRDIKSVTEPFPDIGVSRRSGISTDADKNQSAAATNAAAPETTSHRWLTSLPLVKVYKTPNNELPRNDRLRRYQWGILCCLTICTLYQDDESLEI